MDADGHQQEEDAEVEAELAMMRNARNALRPVQISPREAEQFGWPLSQLSPEAEAFRERYTSGAGGRWGGNPTRNQNASLADLMKGHDETVAPNTLNSERAPLAEFATIRETI